MQHPRSARRLSQRQKCANARASARERTLTHTHIELNKLYVVLVSFSRVISFFSHFKEMFSKNLTSFAGDFEHGSKVDMARSRGRAHTARTSESKISKYESAPPPIEPNVCRHEKIDGNSVWPNAGDAMHCVHLTVCVCVQRAHGAGLVRPVLFG